MVHVDNTDETVGKLNKLSANTQPEWGQMTPQHMVEHITMTLKVSSGKMNVEQRSTPEEAAAARARLLHTDAEIAKGIKSPLMGEGLPEYKNDSLQAAIDEFKAELEYFNNYYRENPEAKHIQPRLGALSYSEWIIFHGKHFMHHFKQFGIY